MTFIVLALFIVCVASQSDCAQFTFFPHLNLCGVMLAWHMKILR